MSRSSSWSARNSANTPYVIDRAEARGPNGVAISMANSQQRLYLAYRVDGGRLRTMESVREGGPAIVSRGVFTANKLPTPWLNRCAAGLLSGEPMDATGAHARQVVLSAD